MIRVIGIGCHPDHLTAEARSALASCDYVVAAAKSEDDALLAFRAEVCARAGVELVVVPDPERDRGSTDAGPADYPGAVSAWHAARADAWGAVIRERGGTAGFLVWGDPSLYDSTIRVVRSLGMAYDVVPGLSAPQLLAARHRIVLHEVGRPLLVTTGRRLLSDARDHDNLVVMLDGGLACSRLAGDWQVWWGANLGTGSERLVEGRLADVLPTIGAARVEARAEAGWVMDTYLLRRLGPLPAAEAHVSQS